MTKTLSKISIVVVVTISCAGGALDAVLRAPGANPGAGIALAAEAAPKESPYLKPDERPAKSLSLQEAIEASIANNLDVAIRRKDPESARYNVARAESVFDPNLESSSSYTRVASEIFSGTATNPLQTRSLLKGSTLSGSVSLKQALSFGGDYSLGWESDRAYSPGTPSTKKFYSSGLALQFTQQLLRGFGLEVNHTDIEVAKLGVQTSEEDFRKTVIDTLRQTENGYWDLSAAISNLGVARESLKLANDLLGLNRKKVEVGTLAPIQITEAEAGVASREEGVILAEADIRNAEDNLRRIMNVPPESPDWGMAIVPSEKAPFAPGAVDLDKMIKAALEKRPEVLQSRQQKRAQELRYRFAQNATKPALAAVASFKPTGDNVDTSLVDLTNDGIPDQRFLFFSGSWRTSAEEVFDKDNYNWSVGLNLSIPIGNRKARADEAQSRIAFEQSQMSLENLERGIQVEVRTAVRAVETGIKRVSSARVNIVLQEKKLEAEQKRYDNGMSTSFQVLTFQNDLTSARSGEIAAITAYNKALVELGRVTATLPERRGVTIASK